VATGGYTDVGGGDWDNCLKKVVYDNLKSDRKIGDRVDSVLTLTPDNGYMPRNADICSTYERRIVTAKIHFSDPYNDDALLSFTDGDVVYKTCVSRDEFERESRTLLEKTMVIVDDVISAFESYKNIRKGQGINYIDRIVMVGGASRMLQVKRELERKFRGKTIYLDDPQLAIAAGAALNNGNVVAIRQRVQHTYGIGTNTTVDVSEYNSHRSERYIDYDNNRQLTDKYWVQTVGSETIYKKRGVSNIIIKGTEIDPRQGYVEASSTFYPLDDNQTQVAFYVYISETHNAWSDYESPQLFGYTIDVPASYRGRARQFEVTARFRITLDGVVVLTTLDHDGNEIRHGRYPE
jgi:molecular chaperone DnaK (HSP70)